VPAGIATLVFAAGILGLFLLDRDPKSHTSKALWIVLLWISLAGSRSLGMWIDTLHQVPIGDSKSSTEQLTEGSPLDRLAYSGLLLMGLIVLVTRRERVLSILKANWPLVAFSLYCAASVSWSDYADVAFKRWIKSLGDFVMVLIILTERERHAAIKRTLVWMAFVLIPISVLFIKFYPDLGRGYNPWTWLPYYTGVTTNKNELGRLCLVLGLAIVWRLLAALRADKPAARNRQLLVFTPLLAMVLWLFWMAGSMTSLSCFVMASGLMVACRFRFAARNPWVVHGMVFTILAASFSALFLDMGGSVLQTMGRDPTLTGRTEIWKLVLGMAGNPLLGTGFESFWLGKRLEKMWSLYWWHPREAHNGYIEMYLSLGWLGLLMFAVVVVTGYRTVSSALRRNAEEGALRLAYFVVVVAYNFTESAFGPLNLIWIFFLLATFSVPGGWIKPKPRKAPVQTAEIPAVCASSLEQVST
jgi:exopolysaccharide production protein ExoQ